MAGNSLPVATEGSKQLAFRRAAAQKKLNWMQYFLDHQVDINGQDIEGDTLLHYRAAYQDLEVVQFLIGKGAEVNIQNRQGKTPLYIAATSPYSSAAMVDLLLKHGANPTLVNKQGRTPLQGAKNCFHEPIVQLLTRGPTVVKFSEAEKIPTLPQAQRDVPVLTL